MPYISEDEQRAARAAQPVFDSTLDEVWADPDGVLRQLRLRDPIHWSEPEQAWILTRHADAVHVLRDEQTYSADGRHAGGPAGALVRGIAAQSPLPYDAVLSSASRNDHARMRRLAAGAFAPASVEALRAPIRALARDLLEAARGDELDAIGQFARPLSLGVTLRLLGIEGAEAPRLARLADLLMIATQFGPNAVDGDPESARREFGRLLAEFPVENGTLLASLREARTLGRLMDDELVALVVFITTVGQAPTVFAIGNALLALLRIPDQLAALRDNPALAANVLDEAARFDPPLRVIRRFATVDTQLGDHSLRPGDQVQVVVTAVNRDPAAFREPNRFDLERGDRSHLGFGWGNHHCLGAPVARAIGHEAFLALIEAFPDLTPSGRLELMAGETAGPTALGILGRPGTSAARLEAARANDVAARSVPAAAPNHACPCGSGRKYKRCHGAS